MMRLEHIEPGRRLQIVPVCRALVVVWRSTDPRDPHDDRAFLRSYGQLLHLAREINRGKATGRRAVSIVDGLQQTDETYVLTSSFKITVAVC
jgi:hypothetical protein